MRMSNFPPAGSTSTWLKLAEHEPLAYHAFNEALPFPPRPPHETLTPTLNSTPPQQGATVKQSIACAAAQPAMPESVATVEGPLLGPRSLRPSPNPAQLAQPHSLVSPKEQHEQKPPPHIPQPGHEAMVADGGNPDLMAMPANTREAAGPPQSASQSSPSAPSAQCAEDSHVQGASSCELSAAHGQHDGVADTPSARNAELGGIGGMGRTLCESGGSGSDSCFQAHVENGFGRAPEPADQELREKEREPGARPSTALAIFHASENYWRPQSPRKRQKKTQEDADRKATMQGGTVQMDMQTGPAAGWGGGQGTAPHQTQRVKGMPGHGKTQGDDWLPREPVRTVDVSSLTSKPGVHCAYLIL
jgi:hypothetical protein